MLDSPIDEEWQVPNIQRHYKRRKLQTNITDEHRCKNPQQNTGKQNLTIH